MSDLAELSEAERAELEEYRALKQKQEAEGVKETPTLSEAELLKTIQKMQAQIAQMAAQQGIPSDPVEAGIANLRNHLVARHQANPSVSIDVALEKLKAFEDSEGDTDAIRDAVDDLIDSVGSRSHSWVYCRQLARDLAKAVREQ